MHDPSRRLITSFSGTLAVVILGLLLIFMIALGTYWYIDERGKVDQDFSNRELVTDEMLHQSTVWIDRGMVLYELAYEPDLTEAMGIFQKAYRKTSGNVTTLNLSSLKEQFSRDLRGDWDLYLIDTSGVIINTTFPDDFGLDFKKYPSLYQTYLRYIGTGELILDRTVKGFAPGAPHRKFAYQGTPDHRYLLEISRNFKNFYPSENKASYRELINTTVDLNPYIRSIELFNSQGSMIASTASAPLNKTDPQVSKFVQQTFSSKNETRQMIGEQNLIIQYLFLPVEKTNAPSTPMMTLVARIVYSTQQLNTHYLQLTVFYILFLAITILIAFFIAISVSRHLTKPLNLIGDDVDQIAGGDLDHQVSKTGVAETERIERSISRMVINLKKNIENLRLREEELNKELLMRQKAEDRYRRLFDFSHEAIFILENGEIRDCNQEACILFSRVREDIVGMKLSDFSPAFEKRSGAHYGPVGDDLNDATTNRSDGDSSIETISHGHPKREWQFIKSDGTLIETEVYLNPVDLGELVVVQVMVRDVTELKELIRRELFAVVQIEENLIQLATINDQIRNPLAIISSLNDLQGGIHTSSIHDQVQRINALIDEIDRGFISTDKVRLYLKKHYEVTGLDMNTDYSDYEKRDKGSP